MYSHPHSSYAYGFMLINFFPAVWAAYFDDGDYIFEAFVLDCYAYIYHLQLML
jgi:hypothetical protein